MSTVSLTVAIVRQTSTTRPTLAASPEAEEDTAAFTAQEIRPTATALLEKVGTAAVAAQWDENDLAEVVIVAEPETAAVGSLHPKGSLYEKPMNVDIAKAQHAKFREVRVVQHGKFCCLFTMADAQPAWSIWQLAHTLLARGMSLMLISPWDGLSRFLHTDHCCCCPTHLSHPPLLLCRRCVHTVPRC